MVPGSPLRLVVLAFWVSLFAVSMGVHDVTNTLWAAGRNGLPDSVAETIAFLDDSLSHWVFFAGFAGATLSLVEAQLGSPLELRITWLQLLWVLVNALFLAGAVFANMAFERTRLDIMVGAMTVLMMLVLQVRFCLSTACRNEGVVSSLLHVPVALYFQVAYGIGFVAAVVYKILFNGACSIVW